MVKTSPSTAGSVGMSPGQRTKVPHATRCSQKENEKREREEQSQEVWVKMTNGTHAFTSVALRFAKMISKGPPQHDSPSSDVEDAAGEEDNFFSGPV